MAILWLLSIPFRFFATVMAAMLALVGRSSSCRLACSDTGTSDGAGNRGAGGRPSRCVRSE